MRKLSILFIGAIFATNAFAQIKSEIKSLEGEKWWGMATGRGEEMPFNEKSRKINLNTSHAGNQASPLLLSNKGRYIWSEKPFAMEYKNGNLIIDSKFEKLSPVQAGKTLKDAYLSASKKHFAPDGKIPPEEFFTHPQFNTWIELVRNQNQADIEKYAEAIAENKFPCGVIMVDGGWDRGLGLLEFRKDKFDDPKALHKKIHQMGYKIIYWIGPFILSAGGEFMDWEKEGVLLQDRTKKGRKGCTKKRAAVIPWWSGFSASYDTTDPKAMAHLQNRLTALAEKYDIDGFKFDGGDVHHVTGKNVLFDDPNATPSDYTKGWAMLAYRFPYNELRASWKMGGKAVVQRLHDKKYSYEDIKKLIPQMTVAGLIGSAYTCPDMIGGGEIGSFENIDQTKFDQRLIVRSAQASALMPMMQFSLAPWRVLDKKHLAICKNVADLHVRFGGYIIKLAKHASKTGEPIVRSMEYEFPNQDFENCNDQFMLGDQFLVAPVLDEKDYRYVKLPKGKWRDELGNIYDGGKTIKIDAPIERLPYFEKIN